MQFVCDNPKCPLHIPLICVDPNEAMKDTFTAPDPQAILAAMHKAGAITVMQAPHGLSFKNANWPPGLAQTNKLELDFDITRLQYAPRQIGYTKFNFTHQGEPISGRLCTVCIGAVQLLLGV